MIYWMAASLRWPNNTLHCLLAPVWSVNRHRSETTVPTNTPLDIEPIDGETQQPEARLATSFTTNKLTVHVCGWQEHTVLGRCSPGCPLTRALVKGCKPPGLASSIQPSIWHYKRCSTVDCSARERPFARWDIHMDDSSSSKLSRFLLTISIE